MRMTYQETQQAVERLNRLGYYAMPRSEVGDLYSVRVDDPVHSNGKIVDANTVILRCSIAVEQFIAARS